MSVLTKRAAVVVGIVLLALACSYDWSLPDGGVDAAGDAACNMTIAQACQAIPFVSGFQQTVDGNPSEFCHVPTRGFEPVAGLYRTCPIPAWLTKNQVSDSLAVVASEDGLHLFVHVDKHGWAVERSDGGGQANLYLDDAIELYFAPVGVASQDLVADDVLHLIIAPPDPDGGLPAQIQGSATLEWIALTSVSAYDIELRIPWTAMNRDASVPAMLFDFGIDIRRGGAHFQSFIEYEREGGTIFCNDSKDKPSANDYSWCTVAVQ